MIGTSVSRDSSGRPLIDAAGSYGTNNDRYYMTNMYSFIGDSNLVFIAKIGNTISYGNLSSSKGFDQFVKQIDT